VESETSEPMPFEPSEFVEYGDIEAFTQLQNSGLHNYDGSGYT